MSRAATTRGAARTIQPARTRVRRGTHSAPACEKRLARCDECAALRDSTACETCPRKAYELACDGHTVDQIAAALATTVGRAGYLLAIAEDRRELEDLRMDMIPTRQLRELLETTRRERGVTATDIAAALGLKCPSSISRRIGETPMPATRAKGREYAAHSRLMIDVDEAGQIVRAMGIAPVSVPWL